MIFCILFIRLRRCFQSNVHLVRKIIGGFTLLELVVVISILGTLASIAVPIYSDWIEKAKVTKAISEIRTLEKAILSYEISEGTLPETLADIGKGGLSDPWGNPYQYLNFQMVKGKGEMRKDHFMVPINTDFDLYSMGPDGKSSPPLNAKASYDDIIRANDGSYVGTAATY